MNTNQENQAWGGKREGAGRPKGSGNKPRISDYITLDEVKALVETAKRTAGDKPELLKFLLEQIFGKARQNIGLDGGEGEPLVISFDPTFHAITRLSETSSPIESPIQSSESGQEIRQDNP